MLLYAPVAPLPAAEGTGVGVTPESVRCPPGRWGGRDSPAAGLAGASVGHGGGTAGTGRSSRAGQVGERSAGGSVRGRILFHPLGCRCGRAGGSARVEEPHVTVPAERRPGSVTCGTARPGQAAGNAAGTGPPGERHLFRGQSAGGHLFVMSAPPPRVYSGSAGQASPRCTSVRLSSVMSGGCCERMCSKE